MVVGERQNNETILKNLKLLGFEANNDQLEAQLNKWEFRRKLPKRKSKAGWQCVGHRVAKRRKQGKESRVVIDGMIHDPQKVAKEISRNQPSSLEMIRRGPVSPRSPEGMIISVCTPSPTSCVSWPQHLPWLMFLEGFTVSIPPRATIIAQVTDTLLDLLAQGTATKAGQDVMCQKGCSPSSAVSQFATGLRQFMPEAYSGECMRRAQRIMHGSDSERLEQFVMIVLFQLSNNIHSDEFIVIWPTVLSLVQISGIMNKPLKRNGATSATSMAVAENLFKIAFRAVSNPDTRQSGTIRNGTQRLIKWLLSSGQDPNATISTGSDGFETGLQAAVWYQEADLALTLLDHGADPDFSPTKTLQFWEFRRARRPLVVAIESDDYTRRTDLIKALLMKGANPNHFDEENLICPLRAAIKRQDLSAVELLIKNGARISELDISRYRTTSRFDPEAPIKKFTNRQTTLGCAAGISPEPAALSMVEYLLDQLRKRRHPNGLPEAVPVESLFTAAALGYNRVLTLLLDQGIPVNSSRNDYTPLHLAAYYGRFDTCLTLLKRGALTEPQCSRVASPLHLAASGDHLNVVQLLHDEWGADINRKVDTVVSDQQHLFVRRKSHLRDSDAMSRSLLFCSSPVGAAMYNDKSRATYQYLVFKGAIISPWAMHYAARDLKNFKLVSFLIENGQDINERDPLGQTLLQAVLAIYDETDEQTKVCCRTIASYLLDRSPEVVGGEAVQAVLLGSWQAAEHILRLDYDGVAQMHPDLTMIHAALLSRDMNTIWKVLEWNPGVYDPRALCVATLGACNLGGEMTLVFNRLLENRPISEVPADPETLAVGVAAWYGNIPLLELLLEKSTPSQSLRISLPSGGRFKMIEDANTVNYSDLQPNIVCALLPIGTKPVGRIIEGVSPLIFALKSSQARCLLLNHGYEADPTTLFTAIGLDDLKMVKEILPRKQSPFGRGLLSEAVKHGNIEMVQILIEAGEDINNFDTRIGNGNTPLQAAILGGNPSILDLVLDKNPDVNASSDFSDPALQLACVGGHLSLAKRLIDLGADINAMSSSVKTDYYTALEGAAVNGRIDIIQLLLSAGARTTGRQHCWNYLRAILSAKEHGYQAAAKVLKSHRIWTQEDKQIFLSMNIEGDSDISDIETDEAIVEEMLDWDDDNDDNGKEKTIDLASENSGGMDCEEEALNTNGELPEQDLNKTGHDRMGFDRSMNDGDGMSFDESDISGGINGGTDEMDFDFNRCINDGEWMDYDFS